MRELATSFPSAFPSIAALPPSGLGEDGMTLVVFRPGVSFADIVAAAIPVLNAQGFKGMRLTAVAELTGLRATGITYYFPRKEELALAG